MTSFNLAEDSFFSFRRLTANDRLMVGRIMDASLSSSVPLIPSVSGHILESRGKDLRPMLLIAASHLCGYDGRQHRFLAAAVEIIHTATLLHDDVVDESEQRRGKLTAHQKWGNKASILVGDFFLAKAFALVVRYGDKEILRLLSRVAAQIAEGEALQLMTMNQLEMTEETYDTIITAKTARLFSASMEMAARLSDADAVKRSALRDYGLALGILYQRLDDILDYCVRHPSDKNAGDDFRQGRVTLPIIHAYRDGSKQERSLVEHCFSKKRQQAELQTICQLLEQKGTLRLCLEGSVQHYQLALEKFCAVFEDSQWRQGILSVADFTIAGGTKALLSNKEGSMAA